MSRVPRIRFKGFEEDWEQRKLGEFGKATGGISIESEFDEHGKYKVISIGSYSEESKYTDQGIRVYKTKKTESRILNKNDLVMILNDKTSSGNIIGRVLLVDKDNTYVYNQRTERIEINKSKFLPEYLYQLLNSDNIREKIICASQGNTQIYVNWTIIREFTYKITTDIEEQGKIARFFISLDHLITLHQRKLEKLKIIKKSMLENLFTQNGEKTPKIRFSGFTEDWEQRKLGEMVEFYNGDRSSRYPNDSDMVFEGIPFINAGDLVLGRVKLDTANKITEEKYNQLSGAKIQCGDIIYCLRGTLGKNAFVDNFDIGTIASSLVDIRPQKIVGKYLFQVLNSDIEYSQRILNDEGAAQPNLSAKNLYLFDIPIPRDVEQIKIAEYLESLDHLITLHQSKLEKLQKIKKSMLESMFV